MPNNKTRLGCNTWSKQIYKDPLELPGRGSFAYVIILSGSPSYVNPSPLPIVPKSPFKTFQFSFEIFARNLAESTQQKSPFPVEKGFVLSWPTSNCFANRSGCDQVSVTTWGV
jgi:hypothetical protein